MINKDYLRIERKDSDLPFYNGYPLAISTPAWVFMLGIMLVGFLYLSLGYLPFVGPLLNSFLNSFSLFAAGFLGLFLVTGRHWKSLFRRPRWGDLGLIAFYTPFAMMVATLLASVVSLFAATAENPGAVTSEAMPAALFWWSRFLDIFQLFGEEFLAILPFLALFQYFYDNRQMDRKTALWLALLLSSLLFGAFHLPTYSWNWAQCLLLIGGVRILLTLSYISSRNLLVAFAVHYLYDAINFILIYYSTT